MVNTTLGGARWFAKKDSGELLAPHPICGSRVVREIMLAFFIEPPHREIIDGNFMDFSDMQHSDTLDLHSLGADLRALRKMRGVTLVDLAQRLGRSVGWLSQVERDMSQLSRADLDAIASALEVPLSLICAHSGAPEEETGYIVRSGARRAIDVGKAGLTEELVSPDLTDDFEMVHSTFAPNSRAPGMVTRPTQEVGYVVSGRLDLTIAGRDFTVGAGDSFRIRGEPFEWRNPYEQPVVAIWVIAPPVY